MTHTHEIFELLENIEWIRERIMKPTKFWIKSRYNPQLGTYFVPMGQMSIRNAKRHERPLYGDNTMLSFDTEQAYLDKIEALKKQGERVHT